MGACSFVRITSAAVVRDLACCSISALNVSSAFLSVLQPWHHSFLLSNVLRLDIPLLIFAQRRRLGQFDQFLGVLLLHLDPVCSRECMPTATPLTELTWPARPPTIPHTYAWRSSSDSGARRSRAFVIKHQRSAIMPTIVSRSYLIGTPEVAQELPRRFAIDHHGGRSIGHFLLWLFCVGHSNFFICVC